MKKYLYLLQFCLLIIACNPAKELIKKADMLESQGNHEEAGDNYFTALKNKPGEITAMNGLKRSAQPVLNEKFTLFSKYVLENKIEEAVKQYKNAEKYFKAAESVAVKLDWPSEYDEVYFDVRDEFVLGLYDNALRFFKDKKFDAAEHQFGQIAVYDSTYKDATILRLNTVLEPLYQRGLRQIAKGQFKDANISFDRILEIDDHYKDSEKQRDIAKESATISLAVFPVVNKIGIAGDENYLNQFISQKLKKNNNPYLRISNPNEFEKNLEARGWLDISNPLKAAEAGKNFGYRYVLIIQLIIDEEKVTPFNKIVKNAFEAFNESILNPITNTYNYISKFKKTTYDDTYEARKLRYKVAYQLVSSADGKVVYSDEIDQEKSDEQHLLSFNGNINNLYQELPEGNFLPPPNDAWREQFTMTKRKLLSKDELSKEMSAQIAQIISSSILPKLK
jgi:tetratricopeptide (TPR) repeat protein